MAAPRRALLSPHDKRGLPELARALAASGFELVATGGTAQLLSQSGISVKSISEVTGAPEILGGRVKTLHPKVYGGLLARREDPAHLAELERHAIGLIDIVVVNLYPFEAVVAAGGTLEQALENIDIGGPSMLRAAAKNHASVASVVDPDDYPALTAELERTGGELGLETRRRLAAKAFAAVSAYDAAIARYLGGLATDGPAEGLPERYKLAGRKLADLRYGENAHQRAALYAAGGHGGLARALKLQGKELSYNNYLDLDAALACVSELAEPAAVIVKHTNPCGVALGADAAEAYLRAREADPVSAFGGVAAFNRPLDRRAAEALVETFMEAVIAPEVTEEALAVLAAKKNLRVLAVEKAVEPELVARPISGGLLLQEPDRAQADAAEPRVVTEREPSADEWRALRFAWTVVKHVKSNAIVFASATSTAGIGAGQTSRVDAARFAVIKATRPLKGTVVASDAFFPFRDGLDQVAEAGATAVIQPGGSVRDDEVIAAANEHGLSMVFTGVRHFRH